MASNYILGLDFGTTSVKAVLVDMATKQVLASQSLDTEASVAGLPAEATQDVRRIFAAMQACVSRLPVGALGRVARVSVCGQMHGVALWRHPLPVGQVGGDVSELVTWQDGRCTPAFLSTLPTPASHLPLSSGHGCATLFWLRRHRPEVLRRYDSAATVHDLAVAALCGGAPATCVQNAASWGYVDTEAEVWNENILSHSGFPVELLPKIVPTGSVAGVLTLPWCGIPEATSVGVAMGDMQCSVFSTLESESDAVLNISTSAQLSFIMPKGFSPLGLDRSSPVQFFPYFKGRYLAVAASLNGGNVLSGFVKMLQQWTQQLAGSDVSEDKAWDMILSAAETDKTESGPTIIPTLYGERHLSNQRASVSNIDPYNVSLGAVTRSICQGVIANIHSMMPRDMLVKAGVQRIVGTGSALLKNRVLQKELERQFDLPVVYKADSDAAYGAALAALALTDNP